ncbi:MAG: hypothetical protein KJ914_15600 [Gammaproteobacteria bacterium]|nr:hypothetical protein [Gammaproteobacteria bacterium]MBU1723655.1 hypothetical protein [Gammaproteobacteria bacterium]MBU2004739.1 hypothetical protein [Gammaproteobacteria bacterium]
MKLKALFTAVALSVMVSTAFAADDKVALKGDASAELKAAYESAEKENSAAKKAGFEWFMDGKAMSKILEDGVKAANEGKDEDAMKTFKKVEAAGKAAQAQAEAAKTAAPHF